jgi:periplasmic divalent cation tolerance protein
MSATGVAGDKGASAAIEARIALLTAPDLEVAERLVQTLVEERIIACGNIIPALISIYRWQGAVERSGEVMIVVKTTSSEVPRLLERVPELHPYEVPEVLVLPIEAGYGPYLAWVGESVGPEIRG